MSCLTPALRTFLSETGSASCVDAEHVADHSDMVMFANRREKYHNMRTLYLVSFKNPLKQKQYLFLDELTDSVRAQVLAKYPDASERDRKQLDLLGQSKSSFSALDADRDTDAALDEALGLEPAHPFCKMKDQEVCHCEGGRASTSVSGSRKPSRQVPTAFDTFLQTAS